MLNDIKKELINHPEKLKDLLESFGYCHVIIRPKYIQFGRDEYSSKKSLVIRLVNNQYLYVTDYPNNINMDLFLYIMERRHVGYPDILNAVQKSLGIIDYYDFFSRKGIFGGFYERIRKRKVNSINIYDESILDKYTNCGNLRFIKDNISLDSQRFFNIRYDVESQGIVIPIYTQIGQLMGVKVRCNWDVEDGEQKYYYLVPCAMSNTLYGFSHNYQYLINGTIFVFEAEKSVMQCHSYGIRNCIALGSGSLSNKQAQMILELNPKKVVFMHDTGYPLDNIMRNIKILCEYSRFAEIEVGYWDYFNRQYDDKISPTDLGRIIFKSILKNEIKMIGGDNNREVL